MSPRSLPLAALFGSLVILGDPAVAQLRADPSRWGSGKHGIKLHSEEVVDPRASEQPWPDPDAPKRGFLGYMGLYEYRPTGLSPGQYTRPHYALGLQSELMRDAMSVTGFEAESCIAPMVRLRAREAAMTGSAGKSLTLLARCSFH
jgi:hypothetical protein